MANGEATNRKAPYSPLGVSGLPRYAGIVFDEWLPELQGVRGRKVLREMTDNSAPIGALQFTMEMLVRRVSWTVADGEDSAQGKAASQLVTESLHDMEITFEDLLADILSMFVYGWSLFETVYKKRDGSNSKYDDGKVGWEGFQMRGQETLLRWDYPDAHANFPDAFVQLGPPDFLEHKIPMDRCLLFRTTTRRSNPEGRSLYRNAYHSWYMAKHLEAIEAIGAERDMAGLPVGKVPSQLLDPDASDEEKSTANAWRDLVTNIRRDEQEGVLIPSDRTDLGHPLFELTLLSTGGQRQFNLGDVIERHEQRELMTCLGDFIMLGHTNTGTQSLGKTKIELFSTAISSFLAIIAAQFNDKAIPRLLKLNGMSLDHPPVLQHGQVERMDLDILGNYIYQLGQAGFVLDTNPQGALTAHLLEQAHLPPTPVGLQNPFPDAWEDVMPNPPGMPPSPGNIPGHPMGPGPGQWKGMLMQTQQVTAPGQPAPPAPGVKQPVLANKARPSIKEPNMPKPERAVPPKVKRGPMQSQGVVATRQRTASEPTAFQETARLMTELAGADFQVVAFDLDNTALLYPEVLVPLANLLADNGITVGVLTGNETPAARAQWDGLGYPEPGFYEAHWAGSSAETAQWKAERCKALDVDVLIDDFSGGRNAELFAQACEQGQCDTVPLQVVLPPGQALTHAA